MIIKVDCARTNLNEDRLKLFTKWMDEIEHSQIVMDCIRILHLHRLLPFSRRHIHLKHRSTTTHFSITQNLRTQHTRNK